jgi:hypothetical protein
MRFDYGSFHIECTARHGADGHYHAHARIIRPAGDGRAHAEIHDSGELDAFDDASDAMHCARSWAIDWCDEAKA